MEEKRNYSPIDEESLDEVRGGGKSGRSGEEHAWTCEKCGAHKLNRISWDNKRLEAECRQCGEKYIRIVEDAKDIIELFDLTPAFG